MRTGLEDKAGMRKSKKSIAKYKGGKLTVAEYLRWLSALPPQFGAQVKDASDEQLNQFARALATEPAPAAPGGFRRHHPARPISGRR